MRKKINNFFLSVRLARLNFVSLFYYSTYFCYYSWVSLYYFS